MYRLALFASGSGTNAENIAKYFKNNDNIDITLILSNKKDAYVLERAKKMGIKTVVFNREQFYNTDEVLNILKKENIDFIVLAGFLWLVPDNLLNAFPQKVINIHPALLPKYGGKGMYGDRVHKAVVANNEKESGITIHYVNGKYDEGDIIFQAKCEVLPSDMPDDVASKVHNLEYKHFPEIIENVILKNN
jgi:phosphoribosylglycinamide formyltransferase-1